MNPEESLPCAVLYGYVLWSTGNWIKLHIPNKHFKMLKLIYHPLDTKMM